jgi:lipopolysaccharide/colanic/teichoic acid biosynthesis glycosyltransferase
MRSRLHHLLLLLDCLWIPLALASAALSRHIAWSPSKVGDYAPIALVTVALWATLSLTIKLNSFSRSGTLPGLLSHVIVGTSLLMAALLSIGFMTRELYSRLLLLDFGVFLLFGFIAVRLLVRGFLGSQSRVRLRVAILGNGNVAREVAAKIAAHPEMMKDVVGFVYPSDADMPVGSAQADTPLSASPPVSAVGIADVLRERGIQEIVVAHPRVSVSEIQKLIRSVRQAGISVCFVPQWYELYSSRTSLVDLEGLPLVRLDERKAAPAFLAAKRCVDLLIGALLLALCVPIVLLGMVALWMRGIAPFVRVTKCGLHGRKFRMWRMNIARDDASNTGVRAWMARLSFTELPQLWNVLRGEMSLVGPRPESPERVKHYSEWLAQRLKMKPGLTGPAQVHGLREQHSSEEKASFDLQYILHWSPFLDLSLLLQTVWTLMARLWAPVRLRSSEKPRPTQQPQAQRVSTSPEVVDADCTHAGAD